MVGSDPITSTVFFLATISFFLVLGVASLLDMTSNRFRLSLLGLVVCVLPFLLYRQPAVYDYGVARGDFDFGFPARYITTQGDSNPYRFSPSALQTDIAAGVIVWTILFAIRTVIRRKRLSTNADLP